MTMHTSEVNIQLRELLGLPGGGMWLSISILHIWQLAAIQLRAASLSIHVNN